MTKVEKKTARKARAARRTKRNKLAVLIVHRLMANKAADKELARFRREFQVVDAIVEPVK